MPSRTSVFSENITVAPARTSRSLAKPSAGLAVTPENASLPPHCMPTTRSDAGQVSRRRRVEHCRWRSAVCMIEVDHRLEADMRGVLQGDQVVVVLVASASTLDGAGRQQPLRLQLLATEADHHGGAAEIRIEADVAQRADRDVGVRRIDGDAAAVDVLERDDVVDVRISRQQLGPDAPDGVFDDAGHALHRGRDRQQIARADRTVGIAKALEACSPPAPARATILRVAIGSPSRDGRLRHHKPRLVDPGSRRQIFGGVADDDVVAPHRRALVDVDERHLVALRHALAQADAARPARRPQARNR